jgi:hypothetical protein
VTDSCDALASLGSSTIQHRGRRPALTFLKDTKMNGLKLLMLLGAAGLAAGLGAERSVPDKRLTETASTWYTCEAGSTLVVTGSSSRCDFPMVYTSVAQEPCPQGQNASMDHNGGVADMCTSSATVAVSRTCPVRSIETEIKGEDKCQRVSGRTSVPPRVPVQF